MYEQFLNDLTMVLSNYLDGPSLDSVKSEIAFIINNYDISRKTTELSVFTDGPIELKSYLVTRKIEGMAEVSVNLYARILREFFFYTNKAVDEIKVNDVRAYLYLVQKNRGISNRTLNTRRSVVSSFFEWCCNEDYISKNPCRPIKPIKYSSEPRQPLNGVEMEMLRNACQTIRDRALVEFLYSTGCRVSELIRVDVSDIDFDQKEVLLFGKRSKYRTSYINAKCEVALRQYIRTRVDSNDGSLFCSDRAPHKRLSRKTIEDVIRNLGIRAGIDRPVFPHLIRHTVATDGLNRGMDITEVQKFLGHENINTTLIYSHVSNEKAKQGYMKSIN